MTLVHFCLCEVLARQKQVLKKFRPKIPIDFLLDPAKAVRWNGSGGGAGCSNENIISTMHCVCWPQLCSAFMKIYPILHAPSTYILQCALMLFRAGGLLNLGLPSLLLLFCGLNENPRRLLREWRMQVTKSFCFRGHTLQSRWRMRRRSQ